MARLSIFLASASPRRLDLLRRLGVRVEPYPSAADEEGRGGEPPRDRVRRLAEIKGRLAASRLKDEGREGLVLAADTVVVLGEAVLGKPRDVDEAGRMLRLLSGKTHEVLTGVFLIRIPEGHAAGCVERTRVRFRPYGEESIRWYLATGEPMDKAGAYGIQGHGVFLTEGVDGSWSNVVGLPLERLPGLFEQLGVNLLDLVRSPSEAG